MAAVGKRDAYEPKQAQALKKYCLNDTGLLNACAFIPIEKVGALLESLVLLALRKRDKTVACFPRPNECDFVVLDKGVVVHAILVSHELTDGTRRREPGGRTSRNGQVCA